MREVLRRPHHKFAAGKLIFQDDHECTKYNRGGTCRIARTASLDISADIMLGAWVMIGHGAQLLTHKHKFCEGPGALPRLLQHERDVKSTIQVYPKIIQDNVWIYSATIMPQCNFIARDCIIGKGAIVTKPITESGTIWVGNPARKIKG